MSLPSAALLLFLFSIVQSSAKSGQLTDKADLIGTNRIVHPSIEKNDPSTKEVESGCQWRGKAPFCEGSCVGDEVQERISSSSEEKIFGSTCWNGKKAFCCLQNDKDPHWDEFWQSAQTGELFDCLYVPWVPCGTVICREFFSEVKTAESFAIEGERCNEVSLFGKNGTKENGKITWKKDGQVVEWWYRASTDKMFMYVFM